MSLDRSLKSANALVRHRNVLTRTERLAKLAEQEKWTDAKSVFGLPKVAHRKAAVIKAVKEETAEGAVAPRLPAPAPLPAAAGAAPAAASARAAAPAARKGCRPRRQGRAPAAKKK